MRLVLASGSPRRAELLTAAGFAFEIVVVDVDELVRAGESAEAYVRRLAVEKASVAQTAVASGFSRTDDVVVLGADTAVIVDGHILGKPVDDGDAAAMLRRLSGRRHDVLTGVSLRQGSRELSRVDRTTVFFVELRDEDVAWYVESGEGRDKAGAYAIQGLASRFILRLEGSYSNVVGLPIRTVVELLAHLG